MEKKPDVQDMEE